MIRTSSSWNFLDCYLTTSQAGYFMNLKCIGGFFRWEAIRIPRKSTFAVSSNQEHVLIHPLIINESFMNVYWEHTWTYLIGFTYSGYKAHYLLSVCLPSRLTFLSDFGVSCDYSGPSIMHGRGFSFERPLWQVGTRSGRESGVEETQEASYLCPSQCLDGRYCWPCLTWENKQWKFKLSSHQERNFLKISCLCV